MVKSPRWLRPHQVTVINVLGEENMEEKTVETVVNHVKVETKRSKNFTSTGVEYVDTILIVFDMNDYSSWKDFVEGSSYIDSDAQWTLRRGDRIRFNDEEYEINDVKIVNPLKNTPEFIEVTAK